MEQEIEREEPQAEPAPPAPSEPPAAAQPQAPPETAPQEPPPASETAPSAPPSPAEADAGGQSPPPAPLETVSLTGPASEVVTPSPTPTPQAPAPAPAQPQPPDFRNIIRQAKSARREARLEKIMAYAREKGRITNDEIQKLLRVSDATASRYAAGLVIRGLLEKVGRGRGAHYKSR